MGSEAGCRLVVAPVALPGIVADRPVGLAGIVAVVPAPVNTADMPDGAVGYWECKNLEVARIDLRVRYDAARLGRQPGPVGDKGEEGAPSMALADMPDATAEELEEGKLWSE